MMSSSATLGHQGSTSFTYSTTIATTTYSNNKAKGKVRNNEYII